MKKEYIFLSIVIAFIAGVVVGVIATVYHEDKASIIPPMAKQSVPSSAPTGPPADVQKKIDSLQSVLKENPKNLSALIQQGNAYFDSGQFDRAIESYSKALEIDPKHVNSRYNLGIVLLHDKGDMKGAIKAWEDYLKLQPTGPRAENIRNQMTRMKAMVK